MGGTLAGSANACWMCRTFREKWSGEHHWKGYEIVEVGRRIAAKPIDS